MQLVIAAFILWFVVPRVWRGMRWLLRRLFGIGDKSRPKRRWRAIPRRAWGSTFAALAVIALVEWAYPSTELTGFTPPPPSPKDPGPPAPDLVRAASVAYTSSSSTATATWGAAAEAVPSLVPLAALRAQDVEPLRDAIEEEVARAAALAAAGSAANDGTEEGSILDRFQHRPDVTWRGRNLYSFEIDDVLEVLRAGDPPTAQTALPGGEALVLASAERTVRDQAYRGPTSGALGARLRRLDRALRFEGYGWDDRWTLECRLGFDETPGGLSPAPSCDITMRTGHYYELIAAECARSVRRTPYELVLEGEPYGCIERWHGPVIRLRVGPHHTTIHRPRPADEIAMLADGAPESRGVPPLSRWVVRGPEGQLDLSGRARVRTDGTDGFLGRHLSIGHLPAYGASDVRVTRSIETERAFDYAHRIVMDDAQGATRPFDGIWHEYDRQLFEMIDRARLFVTLASGVRALPPGDEGLARPALRAAILDRVTSLGAIAERDDGMSCPISSAHPLYVSREVSRLFGKDRTFSVRFMEASRYDDLESLGRTGPGGGFDCERMAFHLAAASAMLDALDTALTWLGAERDPEADGSIGGRRNGWRRPLR